MKKATRILGVIINLDAFHPSFLEKVEFTSEREIIV